jgi:hypothetical protein
MIFNPEIFAAKPTNEAEWLLQLGDSPHNTSTEHIDTVIQAVNNLSSQSQLCIEAIFYERISYRRLGLRLGCSKPHAWRLTHKAIKELEKQLVNQPSINRRYKMFRNWNEACWSQLEEVNEGITIITSEAGLNNLQSLLVVYVDEKGDPFAPDIHELFSSVALHAISHLRDYDVTLESVHDLLCSKQADYGHENILAFGDIGICVRMSDKIARIKNLRNKKAMNESLMDSWLDLLGYAVIGLMLLADTFTLPLRSDND